MMRGLIQGGLSKAAVMAQAIDRIQAAVKSKSKAFATSAALADDGFRE
jgi:hypothetical protein